MEIDEKIQKYEHFLNDKLKYDLKDIEQALMIKVKQLKEWMEIINTVDGIKEFKEKDIDMHVNFNLGNKTYAFGEIVDYGNLYLEIGLGYLLEMDQKEIIKYTNIRSKLLQKEISHLRQLAVNVKVHIKMVLLAINELKCTLAT